MESPRIVPWRYRYLLQIKQYHLQGYLIVYLDETWFDSHNTARIIWSDKTTNCSTSGPFSKSKRVVICHAECEETFVPNTHMLCGKQLSPSFADYPWYECNGV